IYQDTVDEPIAGAIVNLYEKQADGIYVASKDTFGNPIFATTGIDGRYIFDTTDGLIGFYLENGVIVKKQYAVQFLEIPEIKNDTQEFTKNTVYQDVANDNSSVNMNGDSRGFIEGIEALALGSGYLHAGVIDKYTITATIEGSVDTTTDLLFDETKTLDGNVDLGGPNFELFKASTNAYQWQLENPSDSQYIELDSTRTSNEDLDIHVKAIALHKIPISLTVTDIYGNTKKVIHYITVNQLPVISGAEDVTIKVGDVFDVMSGVTASDKEDDDQELTSKIKIITNTVNPDEPGKYEVTYEVTDTAGNVTVVERIVTVNAKVTGMNQVPTITLVNENLTLKQGAIFDARAWVSASDKEDDDQELTSKIEIITNTVNPAVSGAYEVTYKVTDSQGATTTATMKVYVDEAAVISGAEDVTIKVGDVFDVMSGVTASDKEDDDQELTSKIKII
ncbi:MAG: immunoglobulin-like domain-containing protein, partial [Culicoidibacterales bacterium]